MKFYRVEFVRADGSENFEIVEQRSRASAAAFVHLKYFQCVILSVVQI